jgi:hypothetical protein
MNLTIDITIDNVGTTMWVEDTSEWNSLIGGQTYDYFVATQTVTFTNYIDSAGSTTTLNKVLPNPLSVTGTYAFKNFIHTSAINIDGTTFEIGSKGNKTYIVYNKGYHNVDASSGVVYIDIDTYTTTITQAEQIALITNHPDYTFASSLGINYFSMTSKHYIDGDIESFSISQTVDVSQYIQIKTSGLVWTEVSTNEVTGIKTVPGRFIEILPSDVDNSWAAFPEGVYNIQYGVTITSNPSVVEPANNGSYYYQQFIFWEINNYMSNLLVDIANNYNGITNPDTLVNSGALKDDYLYRYAIMFGTKFEALQAAIAVSGSTTTVTAEYVSQAINTMLILQKLMSQYPDGNYTRRFIK